MEWRRGRVFNHRSLLRQKRSGRTYDFNNEYRDTNIDIESKESKQHSVNQTVIYIHRASTSVQE